MDITLGLSHTKRGRELGREAKGFIKIIAIEFEELDGRTDRSNVRMAVLEDDEACYDRISIHSGKSVRPPAVVLRRVV